MPSATVILRWATAGDMVSLITLLRRSWLTTWAPELPFDAVRRFTETDPASAFVEECWASFRIAEMDGSVAALCYIVNDMVESLHVDPAVKGQGLGTLLIAEAEEMIAQRYSAARLEVRAFNRAAQNFYRRRGWTELRQYQGSECGSPVITLEMGKQLSSVRGTPRLVGD